MTNSWLLGSTRYMRNFGTSTVLNIGKCVHICVCLIRYGSACFGEGVKNHTNMNICACSSVYTGKSKENVRTLASCFPVQKPTYIHTHTHAQVHQHAIQLYLYVQLWLLYDRGAQPGCRLFPARVWAGSLGCESAFWEQRPGNFLRWRWWVWCVCMCIYWNSCTNHVRFQCVHMFECQNQKLHFFSAYLSGLTVWRHWMHMFERVEISPAR